MVQKLPKMSLTWGDLMYFLFSDHQSNTKMFCVKYHEKILSFTRYRDVYPMGSKIPHAGPKEKARHIYFLFLEYHTNSKNIFAKFHEEKLKSSQVIEKTTQNGPQKF